MFHFPAHPLGVVVLLAACLALCPPPTSAIVAVSLIEEEVAGKEWRQPSDPGHGDGGVEWGCTLVAQTEEGGVGGGDGEGEGGCAAPTFLPHALPNRFPADISPSGPNGTNETTVTARPRASPYPSLPRQPSKVVGSLQGLKSLHFPRRMVRPSTPMPMASKEHLEPEMPSEMTRWVATPMKSSLGA